MEYWHYQFKLPNLKLQYGEIWCYLNVNVIFNPFAAALWLWSGPGACWHLPNNNKIIRLDFLKLFSIYCHEESKNIFENENLPPGRELNDLVGFSVPAGFAELV